MSVAFLIVRKFGGRAMKVYPKNTKICKHVFAENNFNIEIGGSEHVFTEKHFSYDKYYPYNIVGYSSSRLRDAIQDILHYTRTVLREQNINHPGAKTKTTIYNTRVTVDIYDGMIQQMWREEFSIIPLVTGWSPDETRPEDIKVELGEV